MKRLVIASLSALLLSGVASLAQAAEPATKLLGEATPPTAGERVIVIQPGTKFVNVSGGDDVKFVIGDQTFSWDFNTGPQQLSFSLSRIAPPGSLDHDVKVYVARDPSFTGA